MSNEIINLPVLLVEDDKLAAMIGEELLGDAGFRVDSVVTAEEALSLFKMKNYSIILMDIELSGMSGGLAAREMRAIEKKENKPASLIFAITAHTNQSYKDHCFAMGMTDVIQKPLTDKKIELVKQMLLDVSKETKRTSLADSNDKHIDIKALMKLTNNDASKVLILLNEFSKFLKKMEMELEKEFREKDRAKLINSIHEIAATAAYIHAAQLCKLAKSIESGGPNISLQECMPVYSKVMAEIHRLQKIQFDHLLKQ